jgi:N-acetylglucosamine malate deacetylase 1
MKILIVSAHPDDIELCMGATLSRLKREGHEIQTHIFSDSKSIEGNENIDEELHESLKIYGLDEIVYAFETMHFQESYQLIRQHIYEAKLEFNPDVVYCMSPHSLHPDHRVIGEACESIFLETTVYGMSWIRDWHNVDPDKFTKVTLDDMLVKRCAIECYKSQKDKTYTDPEILESIARVFGAQIGERYAEAFEVIREVS